VIYCKHQTSTLAVWDFFNQVALESIHQLLFISHQHPPIFHVFLFHTKSPLLLLLLLLVVVV